MAVFGWLQKRIRRFLSLRRISVSSGDETRKILATLFASFTLSIESNNQCRSSTQTAKPYMLYIEVASRNKYYKREVNEPSGKSSTFVWTTPLVQNILVVCLAVCLLCGGWACFSAVQGSKKSKQSSCLSYPAELYTERLNFNEQVLKQVKNKHSAQRFCGLSVQRGSCTRSRVSLVTFISHCPLPPASSVHCTTKRRIFGAIDASVVQ